VGCLRLIVLLLFAIALRAGDVALLVDVSGTMHNYGSWQPDAFALVKKLLEGDVSSAAISQWEQVGDGSIVSDFALGTGELHLLPFGSIQGDSFPYFSGTQKIPLSDLRSSFPLSADLFRQSKTNKSLAQAVGTQLAGSSGTAHLIVISDFLIDANLTDAEREFVNHSETAAHPDAPVIYSWRPDKRVQIKLIRTHIPSPSAESGVQPPQDGSIRLLGATVLSRGQGVQFRWSLSSSVPRKYYQFLVRDPKSNRIVFTRDRVLGESLTYADPPRGFLKWQVVVTLENGSILTSPIGVVKVPGADSLQIVLVGLVVCGVITLVQNRFLQSEIE
jgi:hypothetical protein